MPKVDEVIQGAVRAFKRSPHIDHPNADKDLIDAEDLIAFVLGHEPGADDEISGAELRRFLALVGRREAGEPAPYITGRTTFGELPLSIGRGAFIPRESSVFMADQAVRRLRGRRRPVHVDLATGVGPVALSVAKALPAARVFGCDLFPRPVAFARRNARDLELSNATFLTGDLFEPLPKDLRGAVDTVTIHPPYVGRGEFRTLPKEILGFEPRESLTDDSREGMGLLSRVTAEAPEWLRPGGWLLVEVGPYRARAASTTLRRAGFRDVRSTKGGSVPVSRVVVGRA